MIPLQVILLIMTVILYTSEDHTGRLPAPAWIIVGIVASTHVMFVAIAEILTRRAARLLHRSDVDALKLQARTDRSLSLLRNGTLALLVAQLWFGGWGLLVMADPVHTPGAWGLGRFRPFLIPHAVLFAAPLFTWFWLWIGEYRVEAAARARALPYRLARHLPAHEFPSLGQYLGLKARHNLYFFVPMAIATAAENVADLFRHPLPWLPLAVSLALLVILLASLPWMLTRIWSTVPMAGPLRARLDGVAARYHIRFSNILVWKTHHAVNNAAILGYLPFSRYFLMTDALLESLTDDQIEAVFAHEVGHGYHRHIWWYLFAIGGALLFAIGLSSLAGTYVPFHPKILAYREDALSALQLAVIAGFMAFGFSPISRRFEHQADWFAAKHMAAVVGGEAGGGRAAEPTHPVGAVSTTNLASEPSRPASQDASQTGIYSSAVAATPPADIPPELLAPIPASPGATPQWLALTTGAEMFSSALLHIVALAHRSPDKGGWMHPSPNRRVALLRDLAVSPALVPAFDRRMWRTRAVIVLIFLTGAGVCLTAFFLDHVQAVAVAPATTP